jgi:predicted transcriptional regulator
VCPGVCACADTLPLFISLLQATEAAKLEELANHVELLQSTLSKAANDLANAGTSTNAARQDLDSKR